MPAFFRVALGVGLPFGLIFGIGLSSRDLSGVILGLGVGLLIGLLFAALVPWRQTNNTPEAHVTDTRHVLKQGLANHFRGWIADGGKLYLTDQSLWFKPHWLNLNTDELIIPLSEVIDVSACLTAGIVPNGLRVVTTEGEERFVVNDRQNWVTEIERAIDAMIPEGGHHFRH